VPFAATLATILATTLATTLHRSEPMSARPIACPTTAPKAAPFLAIAIVTAVALAGCRSEEHRDLQPVAEGGPVASPGSLDYDRSVWQSLVRDHASIRREVRELANGVEAITESDDPEVAARIRDHAFAMQRRMRDGSRVRQWDPVFVALFDRHDAVRLDVHATDKGVHIIETSDDPEVVRILQSHAAGVSEMVERGSDAARNETPFKPR
jgi:hypothetical protein